MGRRFDGSGDRGATGVDLINFVAAGEGTISLWARPTGAAPVTGATAWQGDCLIGDTVPQIGLFRANTDGSTDRLWAFNWDGNEDKVGTTYTVDEWVHLALVHTGGNLTLYKNGVSQGSVASGNTALTDRDLEFGLGQGGGSDYAGDLAVCGTWNVALAADKILRLAQGYKPTKVQTSGLTGEWLFTEANPGADTSGNGRTITFTNTTFIANPPGVPKGGLASQMTSPGIW